MKAEQYMNKQVFDAAVNQTIFNVIKIIFEEYKKIIDEIETTAYDIWIKELREEWSELSDEMFQICYSYSYTENHSYGHDEVANGMYDIVEFAKRVYNLGVKEASKK